MGATEESPIECSNEGRELKRWVECAATVEDSLQSFSRTRPEVVEHRYLMDTRDRAERRARFTAVSLALEVLACIGFERNCGSAPLLRTECTKPSSQTPKESSAGAAIPLVRQAAADIILKMIEVGKRKH